MWLIIRLLQNSTCYQLYIGIVDAALISKRFRLSEFRAPGREWLNSETTVITMKHMVPKQLALVAFSSLVLTLPSQAGIIFTIEDAGVQESQVPGVVTEDFNSLPLGHFSGAITMGTLSAGGSIVAANSYGGSYGSQYYAIGAQSGDLAATLTLTSPQDYFGMYWPAGDAKNHLEFFDGATLLGSYRVGDIIPDLTSAYYGNPNNGADKREPFVYLNFTTTGSSVITSVKFLNDDASTGFEMDNFSVLSTPVNPIPGHTVPDGDATALLLGGGLALIGAIKRGFRR